MLSNRYFHTLAPVEIRLQDSFLINWDFDKLGDKIHKKKETNKKQSMLYLVMSSVRMQTLYAVKAYDKNSAKTLKML